MQAVGRLGSYISKSVYSVSGPFHPFGGAVDIIVVKQPDGNYKSSPWYVRFGKFQGVLRTKEKVVGISVNDVEADFYMHLDHKGEAFFMQEVDAEEGHSTCSPPSSSGEDTDRRPDSIFYERRNNDLARIKSHRSQILEQASVRGDGNKEDDVSGVIRTESLERAEIAADLLELNWSTNFASSRCRKDNASRLSDEDASKDHTIKNIQGKGCQSDGACIISHSSYQEMESCSMENGIGIKCSNTEYVAEAATSIEHISDNTCSINELAPDKKSYNYSETLEPSSQIQGYNENFSNFSGISEENVTDSTQAIYDPESLKSMGVELKEFLEQETASCHVAPAPREVSIHIETFQDVIETKSKEIFEQEIDALHGKIVDIEEHSDKGKQFTNEKEEKIFDSGGTFYVASERTIINTYSQMSNCDCAAQYIPSPGVLEKQHILLPNLEDFPSNDAKNLILGHVDYEGKKANLSVSFGVADGVDASNNPKHCSRFSSENFVQDDYINGANRHGPKLRTVSSDVCLNTNGHVQIRDLRRKVKSLPCMYPFNNNLEAHDGAHSSNPLLHSSLTSGANDNHLSPDAPSAVEVLNQNENGPPKLFIGTPPRPVNSLRQSRRRWPFYFKRSESIKISQADSGGSENSNFIANVRDSNDLEVGKDVAKEKLNKKKVRTLTPTSEQLMSLKLKEGKNVVVFTFSTAMLGKQQVDAQIFLWRWDSQIVISDVDGTITRSDLLGQVMPLVGMDWSQMGVTHLFSAIKENGYELLFLSARSISQAFHTRQFLLNMKQDGKALPDGPVVISPDGLFPSLFREVVRRVPHEFKISCLEDIKVLFPADHKPFYAGFGNRDTDEFSYLKVGIPRGKIFIINPKGEIVVNRFVDTKSYRSIHGLVQGMFPPVSTCEEEDYNSWNYWKLPAPVLDI